MFFLKIKLSNFFNISFNEVLIFVLVFISLSQFVKGGWKIVYIYKYDYLIFLSMWVLKYKR